MDVNRRPLRPSNVQEFQQLKCLLHLSVGSDNIPIFDIPV